MMKSRTNPGIFEEDHLHYEGGGERLGDDEKITCWKKIIIRVNTSGRSRAHELE